MFAKILLPLVLASAIAPSASAGTDFELRLGKNGKHGSFAIALSNRSPRVHAPRRAWVPGHFETREEKVWVEGSERQVWVAPVYDWRYDHCGRPYRVQLEVGHWTCVRSPGHFECRKVQVWVAGRWNDCRD